MSEQKSHIINLSTLETGHYEFDYQLDSAYFAAIEKTELLGGQVSSKAVLDLREDDFDLAMTVHGVVQVTCDRCLEPMDIRMDVEESVNLEDESEESVEEIKTIDLDWLAYEMIAVNLPLVHSHQPGGCNPQMDALLQDHLCTEAEDEQTIQDGEVE